MEPTNEQWAHAIDKIHVQMAKVLTIFVSIWQTHKTYHQIIGRDMRDIRQKVNNHAKE